jgi:hypothetical protein
MWHAVLVQSISEFRKLNIHNVRSSHFAVTSRENAWTHGKPRIWHEMERKCLGKQMERNIRWREPTERIVEMGWKELEMARWQEFHNKAVKWRTGPQKSVTVTVIVYIP